MRGKAHRLGHNFRPGFLKYTGGHKEHRNPHSTGLIWLTKVDLPKKIQRVHCSSDTFGLNLSATTNSLPG